MAARSPSRTRTSTPKLADAARHVIRPRGIVKTGWPAVAALLVVFGIVFDQWQIDIAKLLLAKRRDGQYAADVAVLSIPRQVGKTYLLGALVLALCILKPGLLVIWTAHHTATSDETFADMQAIANLPRVAKHVKTIRTANGQQAIVFRNGSRIRFGARERGFGRGFKKVGVLVMDEAQILTANAMDNLVPTTARAENPLILMAGTPPKPTDPGEAFTQMRADALEAGSGVSDVLFVEFSADEDADVHDREQWVKANPSYPRHTKARAILRMLKTLGVASFRREALGIWDAKVGLNPEIDPETFAALSCPPPASGSVAYGIKFSPDGARMAVVVAVDGDRPFVEVINQFTGSTAAGTSLLVKWLTARAATCDAIVIDGKSNAGQLTDALLDEGVRARKIIRPTLDLLVTANATLAELVRTGELSHAGQPGLVESVANATRRAIGTQGGWGYGPIDPEMDVCPVEAMALALSGLGGHRKRNGRKGGVKGRAVAG